MRSNRRPNFLSSYLSNDEESAKKDHGNEFRGSKNGGREVWVNLEWPKKIRKPATHRGGRRRVKRPYPGVSGGGWP